MVLLFLVASELVLVAPSHDAVVVLDLVKNIPL